MEGWKQAEDRNRRKSRPAVEIGSRRARKTTLALKQQKFRVLLEARGRGRFGERETSIGRSMEDGERRSEVAHRKRVRAQTINSLDATSAHDSLFFFIDQLAHEFVPPAPSRVA